MNTVLLIIVLSTLTPDDRIKTVNITMQDFQTKALCEDAVKHTKRVAVRVIHTVDLTYECVKREGDNWK